ncbi:acetate uptake transporter [Clostridium sp. WILCCON 0269]|uniref:Acetate uptake transporter n=1 Tax=Candidatus Clostridium eludens TaxID=3381663 RepID=A0ABW8SL09_9CLOT
MNSNETQHIKIANCDPSALGLFGLAVVTLIASAEKLGITEGTSLIIPWAIFLGGFAQLFACINDSKRQNTFGATAFGAFALFWFSVGMTWMMGAGVFGKGITVGMDHKQLGFAFIAYLIFTVFMTIGAAETNKVLFLVFFLINFLFIGLALTYFGISPKFSIKLAGIAELLASLIAFYGSAAAVLNPHFGREFLPTGKPFGIFKK